MQNPYASQRNIAIIIFIALLLLIGFVFYIKSAEYFANDDFRFDSPLNSRSTNKFQSNVTKILPVETAQAEIAQTTNIVVRSLKFKNFTLLAKYIHPKFVVKLFPYPIIYLMIQYLENMTLLKPIKAIANMFGAGIAT